MLCVRNTGCDDLEQRKVYLVLPDAKAAESGYYPGKKVGRTILSDSPGLSDRIVRPTGGSSLPG